ncbi:MAG: ComF family protein [Oscillospiraceae bacterium]|nr:ComF family protein [Oscillospiraceae bacterium]
MIRQRLTSLFFPRQCVLCQKVLPEGQTDLCQSCRRDTDPYPKTKYKISFVAGWTSMWYYNGKVRHSILLYKFYNRRSYGSIYGRLLAEKLLREPLCDYDILTWVPVSRRRNYFRGYDQVELIALAAGQKLETPAMATLRKVRHTRPQSRLSDISQRKANVLGAFAVIDPAAVAGKRILLLDDIITTGSTISECARVLLTAGAKEVHCAAVAALNKEKRR